MGVMLNNITWYWYLTWYCWALQCIARYCMVFSSISFLLRAIKANKAQIGLACWRKHRKNGKMWITGPNLYIPTMFDLVFLLILILFELINQQKNLIWNPCGLFCGCGFCGVVCGNSWRGCFFALFPFINVLSQYFDDRDGSVEVAILGENWRRLLQ